MIMKFMKTGFEITRENHNEIVNTTIRLKTMVPPAGIEPTTNP